MIPFGRPGFRVISCQVSPPSVDLKIPPPAPPLLSIHGVRPACQSAAYSTLGSFGSIERSIAPVESFRKRTFRHDSPPSEDLKIPRSGLGPQTFPSAAT